MNRNLLYAVAASLILSACSELATKEAPIEDRPASSAMASKGAETAAAPAGATTTGVASTGDAMADKKSTAKPGDQLASTPGVKPQGAGVETHGAATQGVEIKPLPGSMTGETRTGMAAGEDAAAAEAAAGGSPEEMLAAKYASMSVPPVDESSPLSQRVILFDFDSSAIREEYRGLIEAHALFLKSSKDAKSILQGHTDERGSRDYNLALGQRRAESVQQAMVLLGVEPMKIESVSLGEEKPVAEGHDESAWAQNRRVEIYYQGE